MNAAITTRPIVQAAVRSAYMRSTLIVPTFPRDTAIQTSTILPRSDAVELGQDLQHRR
jgi:hypothetical protein